MKARNEWLVFARQDYLAAKRLMDDECLANIVLFHCHQCIEKVFKGVLEEQDIDIPKIHNTAKLYGLLSQHIDSKISLEELEFIDSVYTESRYPATLGLLPNGQPTKEDVKRAIDIVRRILKALALDFDKETRGGER